MAATSASTIGHEVSVSLDKEHGTIPNSETFVVKCGMDGVLAMLDAGPIESNPSKKYVVSKAQYEKLRDSGISHTLIDAPASYKPPIVKVQRK